MFKSEILNIFLIISVVNCGVLILSTRKIEIASLQPFDEESYKFLKDSTQDEKIVTFKMFTEHIPAECQSFLENRFTAYVPNVEYYPNDTIELNKEPESMCQEIRERILSVDHDNNTIYLLIHSPPKNKRSASTTEPPTSMSSMSTEEAKLTEKPSYREKIYVDPEAPVMYMANGKAILFSRRALVLKIQNDTKMILGPATLITFDERDTYSRLVATIPVGDGKVTLRFRFPWEAGYWWLNSVEVVDMDGKDYNLTNTRLVSAPRAFSHSCTGETVFSDGTSTLTLFNLQVQPAADNGEFDSAFNCIPYITTPILSGLIYSSVLAVGLGIGLLALGSIKSMDKFENAKTKQLTITVLGE